MKIQIVNSKPQEQPNVEIKPQSNPVLVPEIKEHRQNQSQDEERKVKAYSNPALGLEAEFYATDKNTGRPIYEVTDIMFNAKYLAMYNNNVPFNNPTYYKDDSIEWWKEYDIEGNQVYYKDSTGKELIGQVNEDYNLQPLSDEESTDETQNEEQQDLSIGDYWQTDKAELFNIADQMKDMLLRMDEILQYYIETNGNVVTEVDNALSALDDINTMLNNTDEYYSNPEEAETTE